LELISFALGTLSSINIYINFHYLFLLILCCIFSSGALHFFIFFPSDPLSNRSLKAHHGSRTHGEQALWLARTGIIAAAVHLGGSPATVP